MADSHPLQQGPQTTLADSNDKSSDNNNSSSNALQSHAFTSWDERPGQSGAAKGGRSVSSGSGSGTSQSASDDLELLDDDDERDIEEHIGGVSRHHKRGTRQKSGALYSRVDSQDGLEGDGDDEDEDIDEDSRFLDEVEASLQQPNAANTSHETTTDDIERRRHKRRRVYGGGMRRTSVSMSTQHTQLSLLETSWTLFVAHVCPGFPLLVPYAYSLTGLSFGVPLTLLLLALGASFAPLVLTVEARYVGAGSYAALAGSVFPRVLKIQHLGSALVLLLTAFVGLARALVALVVATDLLIQLLVSAFPDARILHSHVFVSLIVGLAYLIPALLLCRSSPSGRPRSILPQSRLLSELPAVSILLYPLALFILAISLKNLEDYPSLLKPDHGKIHWRFSRPHFDTEPLHTPTLWTGVSILFLTCASSQGSTFEIYRNMRKRALPGAPTASVAESPSLFTKILQRHRWEAATSLAVVYTTVLYIFAGLVGYLDLLVITPNLMSALPINHAWFNVCRVLLLVPILALLSDTNTRSTRIAIVGLLDIPRKIYSNTTARSNAARRSRHSKRSRALPGDDGDSCSSSDEDGTANEDVLIPAAAPSRVIRAWQARIAILFVWAMVIVFACLGRGFRDIASVSEVVGCVGVTWLSFILPAAFHIVLFHVRRPRTIFVTDTSAPDIQTDALLLSKESQLQRKLMGKRIWIDLVAFGLLLPFGIIGFARGIWALASS